MAYLYATGRIITQLAEVVMINEFYLCKPLQNYIYENMTKGQLNYTNWSDEKRLSIVEIFRRYHHPEYNELMLSVFDAWGDELLQLKMQEGGFGKKLNLAVFQKLEDEIESIEERCQEIYNRENNRTIFMSYSRAQDMDTPNEPAPKLRIGGIYVY